MLVASGSVAGAGLALLLGPLLTQVVYLAAPRDLAVLGAVAVIVGLAGLAACWAPAWRSLRIDPAVALRED
jgi:ABC-type antimicrobial peptide transport system permease subunit